MTKWNWDKSADELLDYWFLRESELNKEVLAVIKKLRAKGIKVYLASDHSKYRANDLWENVGLKNYFDGYFFSCYLGTTKDKPIFFKKVLQKLNLKPEEVMFLDDEEENVEAARKLKISASLYRSIKQLESLCASKM